MLLSRDSVVVPRLDVLRITVQRQGRCCGHAASRVVPRLDSNVEFGFRNAAQFLKAIHVRPLPTNVGEQCLVLRVLRKRRIDAIRRRLHGLARILHAMQPRLRWRLVHERILGRLQRCRQGTVRRVVLVGGAAGRIRLGCIAGSEVVAGRRGDVDIAIEAREAGG